MIRSSILIVIILIITAVTARWLLQKPQQESGSTGHAAHDAPASEGPRHGRLLQDNGFALEITIFEAGVPPRFHIYPYWEGQPVAPEAVDLQVELERTGNVREVFGFSPQADFLRSNDTVREPHSFVVSIQASYNGNTYQWTYDNFEGRTRIADELASEAGIATETAGPAVIRETLPVTGRVEIDPNRVAQVIARFPGVVQAIYTDLGKAVRAGERLATVQSNESLQHYDVTAPISGLIIKRNVQVGETASGNPLFTIVDLSRIWVELDIFAKDFDKVSAGQAVSLVTLAGTEAAGIIDWLSPLSSHTSQSIHARVPLANPDSKLRPGQFVNARITIAEHQAELAVRQSAVQRFNDFQVVFARFGEIYEVRMLETGHSDDEWLEVQGGLAPGTEYVTENSYLVKADIEKSGASHAH